MKDYKPHPLAELFPLMPVAEITDLMKSIKARGLQVPITLYEGKILDGRHRYEACQLAGVEPRFTEYDGDDPVQFVLDVNIHRRHLTPSQRAALAAEVAGFQHGGDRKSQSRNQVASLQPSRAKVAESLAVSKRNVDAASKIKEADPETFKQIKDGKITVHAAEKKVDAKRAEAAPEERRDVIGRVIPEEILAEWDRAATVAARLRSCASEIKVTVERGLADKDSIFAELFNPVVSEAAGLHYTLSQIAPHAVCPTCQGRGRKSCQLCRRRGWISKYLWNSPAVSSETKVILEKAKR